MKNLPLFLVLCCFSYTILAQNAIKTQEVSSKIEKVTVFTMGAQVQRKAQVSIPQGETILNFKDIAAAIDKSSIQVKSEGNFTILSVSHQHNYLKEQAKRTEIEALNAQKRLLDEKKQVVQAQFNVYKREEEILLKNQSVAGMQSGLKANDLKEVVDFQRSRMGEVLLKQLEIEKDIIKLDSSTFKIEQQLKALNAKKAAVTSEILVKVLAKQSVSASFDITYLVRDANWFVTYDLRVKDINNPIDLAFKANIKQQTGEDWNNIKLSISNGNPSENGIAPTLSPWYVDFYNHYKSTYNNNANALDYKQYAGRYATITGTIRDETGESLIGATVTVKGTTIGTVTDASGNFTLSLPPSAGAVEISYAGYENQLVPITNNRLDVKLKDSATALDEVVVTGYAGRNNLASKMAKIRNGIKKQEAQTDPIENKINYQATTVVYDIEVPYTVPNDGKVYTLEVTKHTIAADYRYYAAPKLEESAFLTAQITDWQDYNLLDGEVSLYFEGAYLGKSVLDLTEASDTLSVSLGKDKGVSVQRKKVKNYTSRQFLGGFKSETKAFEIIVKNNKQQPIHILVEDQFPISNDKSITIENKESKKAKLNEETQIFSWEMDINPREEQKLNFKYSVKYPKDQVLRLD